jgi:hypothetical protein
MVIVYVLDYQDPQEEVVDPDAAAGKIYHDLDG